MASSKEWCNGTNVECEVDMTHTLSIDGPSHMLHNATESLSTAMEHFDNVCTKMKQISRLDCCGDHTRGSGC